MPFHPRLLVLFVCAFGCLAASLHAAANALSFRTETSATWIDNISRTSNPPDQREAARFSATAAATTFRSWKSRFVTSADFAATLEHVPAYDRADTLTLGPQLGLRRRIGLGAFAPTFDLTLAAQHRHARLTAARGWTQSLGLRFSKRLTSAFRASLHADWSRHDARHAAFDVSHRQLSAQLTWDFDPRWQLTAGAARFAGYFTANAAGPTWARALAGDFGPSVLDYYRSVPRLATHLYGPSWVSYRVSGDANLFWLELSPVLGRNTSLPFRFERIDATNRIGVNYRQDLVSLSLLHRF